MACKLEDAYARQRTLKLGFGSVWPDQNSRVLKLCRDPFRCGFGPRQLRQNAPPLCANGWIADDQRSIASPDGFRPPQIMAVSKPGRKQKGIFFYNVLSGFIHQRRKWKPIQLSVGLKLQCATAFETFVYRLQQGLVKLAAGLPQGLQIRSWIAARLNELSGQMPNAFPVHVGK